MLRGETPSTVVWTGDLDLLDGRPKAGGTARAEWNTEEGRLRLHRELGLMPYLDYETFWAAEPRYDGSVEVVVRTDGDATARCIRTPLGELREENVFSRASCSTAVTGTPCSRDAISNFCCTFSITGDWSRRTWRTTAAARSSGGNTSGLPCIGLPRSGLASLCYEWAGLENAVFLIADHEGLVREVLDRMEAQEEPIVERSSSWRRRWFIFPTISPARTSAGLYDEFMGPGHRRRIERLHKGGVKCAVHPRRNRARPAAKARGGRL